MRTSAFCLRSCAALLGIALACAGVAAQKKDPRLNPPLAPLLTIESSSKRPSELPGGPAAPKPTAPDQRPLSGAENLTLGSQGGGRSYLASSLHVLQGADTNSRTVPGASSISSRTNLSGSLVLQKVWSRHQLAASFSSGTIIDNRRGGKPPVHQVGFSQTISARRWHFLFSDHFSYLPESAFGLSGFAAPQVSGGLVGDSPGGLGGLGFSGPANLSPEFYSSQTILGRDATRVSNAAIGQAQYTVSPRGSFTVTGSYNILRFLDGGFINSSGASFRTGFNYALNGRDTFAVTYGINLQRFEGSSSRVNNHSVLLSYGRRVTGRLAFQAAAGPRFDQFQNPARGSGLAYAWTARGLLQYAFPAADISVSYARSMTGGSGVLQGAESDLVEFSVSHRIARKWTMGYLAGHARNSSVAQLNTLPLERTFSSLRGGVNLGRPLGRSAHLFLNYYVAYQDVGSCGAAGCSGSTIRHSFGIGFNWKFRPLELE